MLIALHTQIASMTGPQFEHFVSGLLTADGHTNVVLSGGPGDRGVDIAVRTTASAGQSGRLIVVQCKRQQLPVGPEIVRQLAGSVLLSQKKGVRTIGLLVTPTTLRAQAMRDASALHEYLRVIQGKAFRNWVRGKSFTLHL